MGPAAGEGVGPGRVWPAGGYDLHPDGLLVADHEGVVRVANSRAAAIIGTPVDQLVGADIRTALPLQDTDGRSWWQLTDPWNGLAIRSGHRERLLIIPGRDEVLVTASYIRPGRSQPVTQVVVALRDAEARRRAEANSAALISTVAHELRSPLTSVKGFSSTLLRRWGRFTDDQKRLMLQTIDADADRVTRLIAELLDISRIDAGRLQVHKQPVDIPAVIRRHIERFVASGHKPDQFVLVEHPGRLPEIWADPDRLDQILANLMENAVRHGDGTVTLTVTPIDASTAETRGGGPAVEVTVADEGEGIAPEHYPLVFTRFWHGSRRGGTGLGLYVVRGLVEAHGGRIKVGRGPAGGAEFRFTLPSGVPEHLG
ncbi:MAG TPA: PAS domain-containing sensor histidine kinase [Dermatophilaceae bacterium]|nr:PAS domain-containing sensor histidine kinase [Dermatophilaceae bacterium]